MTPLHIARHPEQSESTGCVTAPPGGVPVRHERHHSRHRLRVREERIAERPVGILHQRDLLRAGHRPRVRLAEQLVGHAGEEVIHADRLRRHSDGHARWGTFFSLSLGSLRVVSIELTQFYERWESAGIPTIEEAAQATLTGREVYLWEAGFRTPGCQRRSNSWRC